MAKLVCMLVVFVLCVSQTRAQSVSVSGENMSLQEVFAAIKLQTGYVVFAAGDVLAKTHAVNISVENEPLRQLLDRILKPQQLVYEISSKTILVYPAADILGDPDSYLFEGVVTNTNGDPVEGATVMNKRSKELAVADHRGYFSIQVHEADILKISSIGFIAKELRSSRSGKITITLNTQAADLDEATVVAYGTTTRRRSTGAFSLLKRCEFAGLPSANVINAIQGRAAGIDVTTVSASPGSGGQLLTIRGYNSLDVEQRRNFSNPLWVVDGVPYNSFTSPVTGTSLLADINPDVIESIQVLKDASAASLYGSRASNGVVLVNTRKGKFSQKPSLEFNVSQSYSILPELPTITTGVAERNLRIRALQNAPLAYLNDNTRSYTYPQTPQEAYLNQNGRIDYFSRSESVYSAGLYLQDSLNDFFNNATNFFPLFYQTGRVINANLQSYGGAPNMFYGITGGYYKEEGVAKGSGIDRVDLSSNVAVSASKKLTLDMRFNAALIERKRAERSAIFGEASPIIETVPDDPFRMSSLLPGKGSLLWNSIKEKYSISREQNRSVRLRTTFKAELMLLPGLSFSSQAAADYATHRRNHFIPSTVTDDRYAKTIGESASDAMFLSETLVNYQKSLNSDHHLKAVAGFSYQYDQSEYNGGQALNSPSNRIFYARPGFPLLGQRSYVADNGQLITETIAFQRFISDMTEKALVSYFSRGEYAFKARYLFSATIRRDGSSVFGENTRWSSFPSFAAGWIFSDEKLVKNKLPWLSFGKLRASWGKSGMHFSQNYLALGVLQTGRYTHQGQSVILPDFNQGLYNEKLTWEESSQYDIGVDLDFFDSRINITADFYSHYTDNMLMPVRLPGTYNGYLSQWRNAAAISNKGVEVFVGYQLMRSTDFSWRVSINGSRTWNRFEKSYDGSNVIIGASGTRMIIGKPLSGIFGLRTQGLVGEQEDLPFNRNARGLGAYLNRDPTVYYKPGDPFFVDINNDGTIDRNDEVYLGSALPIFSGGFISEIRWKNIELNILFSCQLGRNIINTNPINSLRTDDLYNLMHPVLLDLAKINFWKGKGDGAQYSPMQFDSGSGVYDIRVDRHVERVNWVKFKSAVLRYSLPEKLCRSLKMKAVQTFVSGENLLLFTNYSGIDPETVSINTGIDYGLNYPLARKISIGVSFKF